MKKKVLLTSILSIVMCASLIIGATFALFSSKSDVDISVSSGKVDITATLNVDVELYSMGEKMGSSFENGGTAAVEGGKLSLNNITPGDKAVVTISVQNNSTVAVKYRAMVSCTEGQELYNQLVISGPAFGEWTTFEEGQNTATVTLSIELPESATNAYQGLNTELAFSVEAVQGNADTSNVSFVSANGTARENGEALQEAVMTAEDGATIYVASGTYDIPRENATEVSGRTGWYLPISADNLTLIGVGNAVLTSTEVSTNGSWESQNFITIFGDGVTLEGFTVQPKMDSNKAFEISGADSVLRDVVIECNDILSHEDYLGQKGIAAGSATEYWEGYSELFSGSIYYTGDIGDAVLDNVTLYRAWVSTGSVTSGSITATDLLLDYAGCWYSDTEGYDPVSENAQEIFKDGSGLTVTLGDTYIGLNNLVNDVPAGTVIDLAEGTYNFSTANDGDGYGLDIDNSITLQGAGQDKTIIELGSDSPLAGAAFMFVTADDVTVCDLTVKGVQGGADLFKVSSRNRDENGDLILVENTVLRNVTFTGEANNYLNIHGAVGVDVIDCIIGDGNGQAAKCAVSVAAAKDVEFSGTQIIAGAWGSVGLMFETAEDKAKDYPFGSNVTFVGCDIAGNVYAELISASGTTIEGLETEDGWLITVVEALDRLLYARITDDTAANGTILQIAIQTAPKGAVLNLPAATYLVSSQIVINQDISLIGAGKDNTLIKMAADSLPSAAHENEYYMQVCTENGPVNFEMRGIHVAGPDELTHWMSNVLVVGYGTNETNEGGTVVVDSCRFTNFTKGGIVIKGGSAVISNNEIIVTTYAQAAPNAIQIDMGAVAEITGNVITSSETPDSEEKSIGLYILRGGNAEVVSGNRFVDCEIAICLNRTYNPNGANSALASDALNEGVNSFENCAEDFIEEA